MKSPLFLFFLILGCCYPWGTMAIEANQTGLTSQSIYNNTQFTVNDFLAMDFKQFRTAEGKKLKWTHRLVIAKGQKKLAKAVKKGKIQGTAPLDMDEVAGMAKKNNHLPLIFLGVGLFMIFIPPLALIGTLLFITGFVLGVIHYIKWGFKPAKKGDPVIAAENVVNTDDEKFEEQQNKLDAKSRGKGCLIVGIVLLVLLILATLAFAASVDGCMLGC